ncbi:hypothetical protein BJF83_11040 [Nocardiopsis sp. CNR-923]|nr:hypothetical protein BJF83_11040 [Nocardiopsis sp. CNR-923]
MNEDVAARVPPGGHVARAHLTWNRGIRLVCRIPRSGREGPGGESPGGRDGWGGILVTGLKGLATIVGIMVAFIGGLAVVATVLAQ